MSTELQFSDDWRKAPDPRPCDACGAAETTCGSRRMLSGRVCCESCRHPVTEGGVS